MHNFGNIGAGIYSLLDGQTLTLINTYYFGNDTNENGDQDWNQSS